MKMYSKEYKRRYPGLSLQALKGKLIAAAAMLLVASILSATASYAWYVLSTAPEVTGMKTNVGANGALEIALLNKQSWDNMDLLDSGDFDESKPNGNSMTTAQNYVWSNLIGLGSEDEYGLQKIQLNPARLYLEEDGTGDDGKTTYKVNSATLLKTPVYGEDGRVKSLDKTSAVTRIYKDGVFGEDGYGVRAIGTSSTMSRFQLGMNAARSSIANYTSAARTIASNSLNQQGGALANVVVQYAVDGKSEGFTKTDLEAVKNLAVGMKNSLLQIESALREAFVGYLATEDCSVAETEFETKQKEIRKSDTTMDSLLAEYPGITNMIPKMGEYIALLKTDLTSVNNAISACDSKLQEKDIYTWSEVSGIVAPLADTSKMTVGGKTISEVKAIVKKPDGGIDASAALGLLEDGGIVVRTPSGSGVLSDIADFAGDYTAKVAVTFSGNEIEATMRTATTANPIYLTACSDGMKAAKLADATGSESITDFYGYAVDMAFRTNAEKSNLCLQTAPENRVYEGSTENSALQGGGSYMKFTTQAGLSATKMIRLMEGIRIALMDGNQKVLAMAALDCKLGKDAYTILSDDEKKATGKYAYMNGGAGDYQVSDLISMEAYEALDEESTVEFNRETGEIKAWLYLYDFSMTKNDEGNYTGGMTLGEKLGSSAITALQQDTPQKVTAVVFLDGSKVTNATVAANAAESMGGWLNLQFSSDATLIPASNTTLETGDKKKEETSDDSGEEGESESGGVSGKL